MANTIPEVFFKTAEMFPEKTTFLYKKNGLYCPIKYKEAAENIRVLAFGISQLGIKRGGKIAILSENRPEWAMFDLAIMSMGVISVPLHIVLCPKIIEYILNHSQSEILIISSDDLLEKIIPIQNNLPFLRNIIFLDEIKKAGEITQDSLRFRLNWSKAKVSTILTNLDKIGLIQRERIGKTYKVYLQKQE